MQDGGYKQVYVAPLKIRKSQKDLRETADTARQVGNAPQHDEELREEPVEEFSSPRQRFQNFLRASYPFQPPEQFSETTVTLPLAAGDIVLVHSIHTNGWADGTLLETGARGWLPTNYCEPYDYATMRPLLKALTEFWDIIHSDGETSVELYRNHDYMRGMVAGVRFLLEKSDCLTRDAPNVKQHDQIRKIRKGLLADLSLLVKATKHVLQPDTSSDPAILSDKTMDDMLLKAFQVVTRAVSFFDIWSEEIAFGRNPGILPELSLGFQSPSETGTVQGAPKRSSLHAPQSPASLIGPSAYSYSRPRPASMIRPATLTHRMSYTARTIPTFKGNLASEQLSDTYDAFLGVLASFLGSHMQSRSSSELLLTTQQAVKSCRKLLEIVEVILEHDVSTTEDLQQAKDVMYDKITELVHAAREVFRPLHGDDIDMIYLPGEGARLVNAATACVSGAGRCVAKARVLLEDIGDFELELRNDSSETTSPFDGRSLHSPIATAFGPTPASQDIQPFSAPFLESIARRPSKPYLDVPAEIDASSKRDSSSVAPTSAVGSSWTPMTEATGSPATVHSDSSAEVDTVEIHHTVQQQRSLARAILHGSESTLVSSARDSGPSFVSQSSTRATSPDMHSKGSPKNADDDRDDGEDALMEYHFAHELLISAEGRVVGGTLNAIVERLTSHERAPDPEFVTMVYLTFRLWTSPTEFAQGLAYRHDYIEQSSHIANTVRLRVLNILKGWLESHWRHDCDESTIPFIRSFIQQKVLPTSTAGKTLLGLLDVVTTNHGPAVPRILSSMGKTNTAASIHLNHDQPAPVPVLSKTQLVALKTWKMGGAGLSMLDFDPLELARQLTIKTSTIFCSILPEELVGCEFMKQSSSLAVNVREMATLATDITAVATASVLEQEDAKKRAAVIKHWIKVAARCMELHNYEMLVAIMSAINIQAILRLEKTWSLIGQKTKNTWDKIIDAVDLPNKMMALRKRLVYVQPPCVPFVGMYRTDLLMVDQGNPSTRTLKTGDGNISVINLDKYLKTACYISDMQRFQVAYKLTSVDELQTWIQDECIRVRAAADTQNFIQNQYRRSLILEPKVEQQQQLQVRPTMGKIYAFPSITSFKGKDKFDLLAWTHTSTKEWNNDVS